MPKPLTYEEVLILLSEEAGKGKLTAMIALERALRAQQQAAEASVEDELDELLASR